jgi:Transposase family tnp2
VECAREDMKTVYLGHRRFLRRQHSYRKKTVEFNEKVENGNAPMELTGLVISDKVKNIQVEFGKGKKRKG